VVAAEINPFSHEYDLTQVVDSTRYIKKPNIDYDMLTTDL
jgi:hypothetical protein